MKKLLVALIVALTIASINNAKTNEPLLSRCHVLNRIRMATIQKLKDLDKKAQDGDIASAHELNNMRRFCNGDFKKFTLFDSYQINEDFLVDDYVCVSLSEEAYEECKDVFETVNQHDSIQKEIETRIEQIKDLKKHYEKKTDWF